MRTAKQVDPKSETKTDYIYFCCNQKTNNTIDDRIQQQSEHIQALLAQAIKTVYN